MASKETARKVREIPVYVVNAEENENLIEFLTLTRKLTNTILFLSAFRGDFNVEIFQLTVAVAGTAVKKPGLDSYASNCVGDDHGKAVHVFNLSILINRISE